jgi:hypothetical protein
LEGISPMVALPGEGDGETSGERRDEDSEACREQTPLVRKTPVVLVDRREELRSHLAACVQACARGHHLIETLWVWPDVEGARRGGGEEESAGKA